jgi:hypothetical protein
VSTSKKLVTHRSKNSMVVLCGFPSSFKQTNNPDEVDCKNCRHLMSQEGTSSAAFDYKNLSTPMMKADYLNEVIHIFPDWRRLLTPDDAERELEGFVWRGPGWYINDNDSLLVFPSPLSGEYWFWVYNGRSPHEGMMQATRAPVRIDDRGENKNGFVRDKAGSGMQEQLVRVIHKMFKDHVVLGQPIPLPRDISAVIEPLLKGADWV